MLMFLGVLGLILGTGLAINAQWAKNKQAEQQARDTAAVAESEQGVLRAQQAEADKDILAAGNIFAIDQKAMNIQGQQIAYAGAAEKGQVGARAGAGNLGGASILKQALSVQRKTEQQMSLLAGEKQKLDIEYSDTLREFDIKKMSLATSLMTSELEETRATEEADYLRDYGWMSLVGIGLKGLAAGLAMF